MTYHWRLVWVTTLLACTSCGGEQKPRSLEEISREQMELPALYITESGERVRAPGNQGVVIHESSGEIAWRSFACHNPDCPGRGRDGEPYLFPMPDPRFYVKEDGSLGSREFDSPEDWNWDQDFELACPKCLELRNRAGESSEERLQYLEWCQLYVLPETEQRVEQLKQEYQARVEYINRRIGK